MANNEKSLSGFPDRLLNVLYIGNGERSLSLAKSPDERDYPNCSWLLAIDLQKGYLFFYDQG